MLVLQVDDDADDRDFFRKSLEEIDPGISCVQFENGYQIIAYLALTEDLPDFIFVDINMPKMNGYECVEAIRSMERMKDVSIVMHSTFFSDRDRELFSKTGFKMLKKPYYLSMLTESIKSLLFDLARVAEEQKK